MVILLKPGTTEAQANNIIDEIVKNYYGVTVSTIIGKDSILLGIVGDTSQVDASKFEHNEFVHKVARVSEPYKRVNRKFHPDNTVVTVGENSIGGKKLALIAGPCSVESREQLLSTANSVKVAGATFLRGGAFKPRSSPYAFQGMELDGIELLKIAREETGLPIVSEILSVRHLDAFLRDVDVLQVGARNMQNFDLLKELGHCNKPILLKRGLSSTIEELLMSAEYILAGGNNNVILCERGIRTFETATRNTLDISAIPVIKAKSHLPVIIDPSHACGKSWMVPALAKAAVVVGADGLIIEVHNDPANAKCDGQQSLSPDAFMQLTAQLRAHAELEGREI